MYDCMIVGGGIAGLQAAIQMGRYEHSVLVVDAGEGRSTLCRCYHNILGWPNGVSGEQLRALGREQAGRLGVEFVRDQIVHAVREQERFRLTGGRGQTYVGTTLLLATGIMDRFPNLPGLKPCLGLTVYVCPDCDGYEVRRRRTIVMGSGKAGAQMALTLSDRTRELIFVNHEREPIGPELFEQLRARNVGYAAVPIAHVLQAEEGKFAGVRLASGETIAAERGFIAFGGNEVRTSLAAQLGVERMENKHVITDPRTKMTSVSRVWAAGDAGVHAEQVTIAMGEGMQAAIWMHKALMHLKEQPQAAGIAPQDFIGRGEVAMSKPWKADIDGREVAEAAFATSGDAAIGYVAEKEEDEFAAEQEACADPETDALQDSQPC